jgi:hypothetical protein
MTLSERLESTGSSTAMVETWSFEVTLGAVIVAFCCCWKVTILRQNKMGGQHILWFVDKTGMGSELTSGVHGP